MLKRRKQVAPEPELEFPDYRPSPADIWERKERAEMVRSAVTSLSPKQKEIIDLYYFQGHRIQEVAQKLGLSLGGAKARLHYARKKLKIIISELLGMAVRCFMFILMAPLVWIGILGAGAGFGIPRDAGPEKVAGSSASEVEENRTVPTRFPPTEEDNIESREQDYYLRIRKKDKERSRRTFRQAKVMLGVEEKAKGYVDAGELTRAQRYCINHIFKQDPLEDINLDLENFCNVMHRMLHFYRNGKLKIAKHILDRGIDTLSNSPRIRFAAYLDKMPSGNPLLFTEDLAEYKCLIWRFMGIKGLIRAIEVYAKQLFALLAVLRIAAALEEQGATIEAFEENIKVDEIQVTADISITVKDAQGNIEKILVEVKGSEASYEQAINDFFRAHSGGRMSTAMRYQTVAQAKGYKGVILALQLNSSDSRQPLNEIVPLGYEGFYLFCISTTASNEGGAPRDAGLDEDKQSPSGGSGGVRSLFFHYLMLFVTAPMWLIMGGIPVAGGASSPVTANLYLKSFPPGQAREFSEEDFLAEYRGIQFINGKFILKDEKGGTEFLADKLDLGSFTSFLSRESFLNLLNDAYRLFEKHKLIPPETESLMEVAVVKGLGVNSGKCISSEGKIYLVFDELFVSTLIEHQKDWRRAVIHILRERLIAILNYSDEILVGEEKEAEERKIRDIIFSVYEPIKRDGWDNYRVEGPHDLDWSIRHFFQLAEPEFRSGEYFSYLEILAFSRYVNHENLEINRHYLPATAGNICRFYLRKPAWVTEEIRRIVIDLLKSDDYFKRFEGLRLFRAIAESNPSSVTEAERDLIKFVLNNTEACHKGIRRLIEELTQEKAQEILKLLEEEHADSDRDAKTSLDNGASSPDSEAKPRDGSGAPRDAGGADEA